MIEATGLFSGIATGQRAFRPSEEKSTGQRPYDWRSEFFRATINKVGLDDPCPWKRVLVHVDESQIPPGEMDTYLGMFDDLVHVSGDAPCGA